MKIKQNIIKALALTHVLEGDLIIANLSSNEEELNRALMLAQKHYNLLKEEF